MFNKFPVKAIFKKFQVRLFANFNKLSRTQSHYDILGLAVNCSTKDIKSAYIELSKKYHPDISTSENSHKQFIRIAEAYNVLSKPKSRSLYDQQLNESTGYSEHFRQSPPNSYNPKGYTYYGDPFFRRRNYKRHYRDNSYRETQTLFEFEEIMFFSMLYFFIIMTMISISSSTAQYDEVKKQPQRDTRRY